MLQVLDVLQQKYKNPLIIAVDACLGSYERVGFINIKKGSLKPGTALKKTLPEVGDFHISGVVNVGGFLEHMVLQNTRLYLVYPVSYTHLFDRWAGKRVQILILWICPAVVPP